MSVFEGIADMVIALRMSANDSESTVNKSGLPNLLAIRLPEKPPAFSLLALLCIGRNACNCRP